MTTMQERLRNSVTANAIRHEAAQYIDDLEYQITELQQQLANEKLKNLHQKIDNSIKTEKILAALKVEPVSNAEIRRQLGTDMINAERYGDRYES